LNSQTFVECPHRSANKKAPAMTAGATSYSVKVLLVPAWQSQKHSGCELGYDQEGNQRKEPVTDLAVIIVCGKAHNMLLPMV
jgi:hypothetical protein